MQRSQHSLKPTIPPGQSSAQRGSVATRPWHQPDSLQELREVSDFIASRPTLRHLLGPNFEASVGVTPSGKGLMFVFESAS
jgi:hypothetical protein